MEHGGDVWGDVVAATSEAGMAEHEVVLTLGDPPGETTHWTAAAMAEAAGISASSVRRIWHSHGLQVHGSAG